MRRVTGLPVEYCLNGLATRPPLTATTVPQVHYHEVPVRDYLPFCKIAPESLLTKVATGCKESIGSTSLHAAAFSTSHDGSKGQSLLYSTETPKLSENNQNDEFKPKENSCPVISLCCDKPRPYCKLAVVSPLAPVANSTPANCSASDVYPNTPPTCPPGGRLPYSYSPPPPMPLSPSPPCAPPTAPRKNVSYSSDQKITTPTKPLSSVSDSITHTIQIGCPKLLPKPRRSKSPEPLRRKSSIVCKGKPCSPCPPPCLPRCPPKRKSSPCSPPKLRCPPKRMSSPCGPPPCPPRPRPSPCGPSPCSPKVKPRPCSPPPCPPKGRPSPCASPKPITMCPPRRKSCSPRRKSPCSPGRRFSPCRSKKRKSRSRSRSRRRKSRSRSRSRRRKSRSRSRSRKRRSRSRRRKSRSRSRSRKRRSRSRSRSRKRRSRSRSRSRKRRSRSRRRKSRSRSRSRKRRSRSRKRRSRSRSRSRKRRSRSRSRSRKRRSRSRSHSRKRRSHSRKRRSHSRKRRSCSRSRSPCCPAKRRSSPCGCPKPSPCRPKSPCCKKPKRMREICPRCPPCLPAFQPPTIPPCLPPIPPPCPPIIPTKPAARSSSPPPSSTPRPCSPPRPPKPRTLPSFILKPRCPEKRSPCPSPTTACRERSSCIPGPKKDNFSPVLLHYCKSSSSNYPSKGPSYVPPRKGRMGYQIFQICAGMPHDPCGKSGRHRSPRAEISPTYRDCPKESRSDSCAKRSSSRSATTKISPIYHDCKKRRKSSSRGSSTCATAMSDPCKPKHHDPCAKPKKHHDPCAKPKKHHDPCAKPKKHHDPCAKPKKHHDPCAKPKKKRDPCAKPKKHHDPCKPKKHHDPCKPKKHKKRRDPCAKPKKHKKRDPCKRHKSKPKNPCDKFLKSVEADDESFVKTAETCSETTSSSGAKIPSVSVSGMTMPAPAHRIFNEVSLPEISTEKSGGVTKATIPRPYDPYTRIPEKIREAVPEYDPDRELERPKPYDKFCRCEQKLVQELEYYNEPAPVEQPEPIKVDTKTSRENFPKAKLIPISKPESETQKAWDIFPKAKIEPKSYVNVKNTLCYSSQHSPNTFPVYSPSMRPVKRCKCDDPPTKPEAPAKSEKRAEKSEPTDSDNVAKFSSVLPLFARLSARNPTSCFMLNCLGLSETDGSMFPEISMSKPKIPAAYDPKTRRRIPTRASLKPAYKLEEEPGTGESFNSSAHLLTTEEGTTMVPFSLPSAKGAGTSVPRAKLTPLYKTGDEEFAAKQTNEESQPVLNLVDPSGAEVSASRDEASAKKAKEPELLPMFKYVEIVNPDKTANYHRDLPDREFPRAKITPLYLRSQMLPETCHQSQASSLGLVDHLSSATTLASVRHLEKEPESDMPQEYNSKKRGSIQGSLTSYEVQEPFFLEKPRRISRYCRI